MDRLRRLSRGGRLLLALVVGGAVFGIATAVQADIPDAGVIHGCYGKPGTTYKGQLRVRDFDQGEQCRLHENPLDWNQTGPTGPAGVTGPTGPTGPAGVLGTQEWGFPNYLNCSGGCAAGTTLQAIGTCPIAGTKLLSGGGHALNYLASNFDPRFVLVEDMPLYGTGNEWTTRAILTTSATGIFEVDTFIICTS
jgi:hypothetical protein